jgi:hypothetical protein
MTRVVVHIERLVLNGFEGRDRAGIADGLQAELGRVFADRETVSQLRGMASVQRLQVRGIQYERDSLAARVGQSVGQAISKEIKR